MIGELPIFEQEDIPDNVLSILQNENLIVADDGYSNNITASITASVISENAEHGLYTLLLNVVNMFNDTYSTELTINTLTQGPILKLHTNEVTLHVGDAFNFYNYIEYAKAADGSSLHNSIHVQGSVNTSRAGTYTVSYYCIDDEGNVSPKETLVVTVER